ncbi:putative D-galacturonate reductase [Helianthus annuus]|nr:putative D-galacturonate reductase [Helianthus annuus]
MKLPIPNECIASIDIKAVWESMEECQNLGLTKSIGVSNFSSKRIKEILSFSKIPPAVNQVEMNPLWQQKKLNEFCKENGIVVTAYSPLGAAGNSAWGDNHVMECDVLQDIAKSKGKTVAQVFFRTTSMHQSGHSGVGLFTSRVEPSGPLLVLGSFTNRTERSGSFKTEPQINRAFFEQ